MGGVVQSIIMNIKQGREILDNNADSLSDIDHSISSASISIAVELGDTLGRRGGLGLPVGRVTWLTF